MGEPSLRDLQRWMKRGIRAGELSHAPRSEGAFLNTQRGTPGVERLAVYASGYLARFRDALAEVYDAIHHVVGKRAFTELVAAYAERHPSHDYNLTDVGRYVADFLSTSPLTQRLPFLPDLARVEWLVSRAFHAFDHPPIDPARCPTRSLDDWARTCLVFQPSVGLVASRWPVLEIWEARTRPRAEIRIDIVNRPQRVLVFRQALQVRCALLDARQYGVLEGLLNGRTLGAVCESLADHVGDDSMPMTQWFTEWMTRGIVQDVWSPTGKPVAPSNAPRCGATSRTPTGKPVACSAGSMAFEQAG